ncbi:hypothetical protein [Methylocystis rosea]|uniref:hypothetical protein n=1 Tax=Methylocystis rosea TaxID=173366 RepID=UPI00036E61F4|nr:hypothetical protein [Methylocystis rosea]
MKQKDFTRLIDTIFAAKSGEELLCTQYFDELPRYVDIEISGQDAGAMLPEVKHHMHQCPECEEVYLALLSLLDKEKSSDPSR